MDKIRNAGKKHRALMVAVVAILCVSMLIGFAIWGSSSMNNRSAGTDLNSQISYYEDYINGLLNSAEKDNTTNGQLGGAYEYLASLYTEAGDTEKADAATASANQYYVSYYEALVEQQRNAEGDTRAMLASYLNTLSSYYSAIGESEKSTAAYNEALGYQGEIFSEYSETAKSSAAENTDNADMQRMAGYYLLNLGTIKSRQGNTEEAAAISAEAAEYYGKAVELLADDADASVKASYMLDQAVALNAAGDVDAASALYKQCVELAPDNINVVQAYLQFVMQNDGIDAAYELLPTYQPYFTSGTDKETFDNLPIYIGLFYQIMHSSSEEGEEGGEATEEK